MESLVILNQHAILTDMAKFFIWPGLAFGFCMIVLIIVLTAMDEKVYWQFYMVLAISVIMIIVGVALPRQTVLKAYAPEDADLKAIAEVYYVTEKDGLLLTLREKDP